MQKLKRKSGKRIQSAKKQKKKSERSKEVHSSIKRSKESIHIPGKRTLVEKWTQQYWISQLRKLNLLSDTNKLYLNQDALRLICGEW